MFKNKFNVILQLWTLIIILLSILQLIHCNTLDFEHPLFDRVITVDYKVHVEAGKQDCFYQYTLKGALLYVDFNVISGGDIKTGFKVLDPNGLIVMSEEWNSGGSYESSNAIEGYYGACIDNTLSIFTSKLVNFYFHTYLEEYVDILNPEQLEIEIGLDNLTSILSGVGSKINKMITYLHQSKAEEGRDFTLLEQNKFYVLFWSLVQCIIIIITGSLHVYFIRKLFRTPMMMTMTSNSSIKYQTRL